MMKPIELHELGENGFMKRYTSIMLSIETYRELHRLKEVLEETLGKTLTFDKTVMLLIRLKVSWEDLMLEAK